MYAQDAQASQTPLRFYDLMYTIADSSASGRLEFLLTSRRDYLRTVACLLMTLLIFKPAYLKPGGRFANQPKPYLASCR